MEHSIPELNFDNFNSDEFRLTRNSGSRARGIAVGGQDTLTSGDISRSKTRSDKADPDPKVRDHRTDKDTSEIPTVLVSDDDSRIERVAINHDADSADDDVRPHKAEKQVIPDATQLAQSTASRR